MSSLLLVLVSLFAACFCGSLDDVKHVVIFMQENRAFDHYYGLMRGVRGFNDRSAPLLPTGRSPFYQPISKTHYDSEYLLPFHLSFDTTSATCMAAPTMNYPTDIGMWNDGKMDAWNTARDAGYGMSYFNRSDLPFYYALGDNFLVGDYYFQSTFTQTNPNRLHLFSGSNGLSVQYNVENSSVNPDKYVIMDDTEPSSGINWQTMAETLQDAGITWKVYQEYDNFDDNAFAWFDQFKKAQPGTDLYDLGMARVDDLVEAFAKDVRNDSLPQVSWIVGPTNLSEHAENHPQDGEDLSARLIKVLGDPDNKHVYAKTVFILNYDEGGQFYDHLWVPTAPMNEKDGYSDGKSTVTTDGEVLLVRNDEVSPNNPIGPGFRVPLFIVSPWTHHAGGIVYSELTDHTSVLMFVEKKFGVRCPNISPWRRAVMSNLMHAFDFDSFNTTFPTLPDTSQNINESHYECEDNPAPKVPSSADDQFMPSQEVGTKKSRKLPYSFDIYDTLEGSDKLKLTMNNTGKAGVVFHVFNYLNTTHGPKKYTIETGKYLEDSFDIQSNGKYNYSLHGPNGYVRQFAGNADDVYVSVRFIEMPESESVAFEFGLDATVFDVENDDNVELQIVDLAYGIDTRVVTAKNGDEADSLKTVKVSVKDSGYWYDFVVKAVGKENSFERRFMGRIETGKDSITDPAMANERKDEMRGMHPKVRGYFESIQPKSKVMKEMCFLQDHRRFGLTKDFCWNRSM